MIKSNWVYGRSIDGSLKEQREWLNRHFHLVPEEILKFTGEFLVNKSIDRILDFGCGDQLINYGMKNLLNNSKIYGCDIGMVPKLSKNRLERLTNIKLNSFVPFIQNGEKDLPFKSNSFDFIYSWSVFEHVKNPDFVLGELSRILKPNGILFIQIFPLYYSAWGHHLWWHPDFTAFLHLIDYPLFLKKFEEFKETHKTMPDFLNIIIDEVESLNKIKVSELTKSIENHDLKIVKKDFQFDPIINHDNLKLFDSKDLSLSQIKILAQK